MLVIGFEVSHIIVRVHEITDVFHCEAGAPVVINNYRTNKEGTALYFVCPPQRVIAYHQNNIETVAAMGEKDTIIAAVGRFVTVSEADQLKQASLLDSIPYYGQCGINQEMAVALQPDFILGWESSFAKSGVWSLGTTDFWQKRGVNCYMALQQSNHERVESVEGECQYILDMGAIFHKEDRAQSLVDDIDLYINQIFSQIQNRSSQTVLILDFMGHTIVNYGRQRLPGDIVLRLGGCLPSIGNRISPEEILITDPDVLFILYKTNTDKDVVERFLRNPLYAHLRCVQNSRVYALPLTYVYNSGLRVQEGLRMIAVGLYPDLADDI